MLAHERHQQILQMMQQTRSIRISEIAKHFDVSNETARRDLEYLQKKGYLRRVHGGANLIHTAAPLPAEPDDENCPTSIRALLAQEAIQLVEDNDILFLGPGSTIQELSRLLPVKQNLTVMTYSLYSIHELMDSDVTLYALGGLISRDEQNMTGSITASVLSDYFATKAILSCGGISESGNVSDYSKDSTLQKLMLRHADKRILIADSSKFGRHSFSKVCKLNDYDVIVTDSQIPDRFREMIEQQGIELHIVQL